MSADRWTRWLIACVLSGGMAIGCNGSGPADGNGTDTHNGGDGINPTDGTSGTDAHYSDGAPVDTGPDVSGPCTDFDNDGISDLIEGRYAVPPTDTDHDGVPDWMSMDSDSDGISDLDEGVRNYPGFASEALPPLTCGNEPNNCSPVSGVANWRNLDSDADGLPDHDEVFTWHTDPCNATTHNDPVTGMPVSDLIWAAAGGMAPPPSALYVVLPYADPSCMTPVHTHRQFDFATRFHSADIFFIIDTTGSMGGTINTLQTTLSGTVIPGILSAIGPTADVRIGAADFRSFPESTDGSAGSDYIVHVGQRLTRNYPSVQGFINSLAAGGGGDYAEPSTEAIWQVMVGDGLSPGIPGHDTDLTVAHGCAMSTFGGSTCTAPDAGWASAVDLARDCGDEPDGTPSQGWGCFQPGRVPIVLLFSDANWVHDLHDNCDGNIGSGTTCASMSATYAHGGHTFSQVDHAMTVAGAYFIGTDVSSFNMDTHGNSVQLAADTGTLDGTGTPIAPRGAPTAIASIVVSSVATLVNDTRQNVTSHVTAVMDSRIATGHTSADFIKAVTPARANPPAPLGYDHSDATTFYAVDPSAVVTFDVDFFNDFQMPAASLQLFQATIIVLGRAGSELDRHQVYIVVPSLCMAPL